MGEVSMLKVQWGKNSLKDVWFTCLRFYTNHIQSFNAYSLGTCDGAIIFPWSKCMI